MKIETKEVRNMCCAYLTPTSSLLPETETVVINDTDPLFKVEFCFNSVNNFVPVLQRFQGKACFAVVLHSLLSCVVLAAFSLDPTYPVTTLYQHHHTYNHYFLALQYVRPWRQYSASVENPLGFISDQEPAEHLQTCLLQQGITG
jgi:hypothetical protein